MTIKIEWMNACPAFDGIGCPFRRNAFGKGLLWRMYGNLDLWNIEIMNFKEMELLMI